MGIRLKVIRRTRKAGYVLLAFPPPLSEKVISATHAIYFYAFHHFKTHDSCPMACTRTSHTVNVAFYHVIQSALESKV